MSSESGRGLSWVCLGSWVLAYGIITEMEEEDGGAVLGGCGVREED